MTELLNASTVGRNISVLLAKNDVRSGELANYMGVTPSTISRWKHGRGLPTAGNMYKIAMFFNTSIAELVK